MWLLIIGLLIVCGLIAGFAYVYIVSDVFPRLGFEDEDVSLEDVDLEKIEIGENYEE